MREHTRDIAPGRADEMRRQRREAAEAERHYVDARQAAIAAFGLAR